MNTVTRFAILLGTFACGPLFAQTESNTGLERGTPAVVVERKAPSFPGFERKRGRQGWVQLNYVISKDGRVIDPVIEDSSGGRNFERAALKSLETWRFKPATWNGEPVEQCHTRTMVSFVLEDTPVGGKWSYVRRYKEINQMLIDGELDEAAVLIHDLENNWDLNVYEIARTWMLRGILAGQQNNDALQLISYRRAVASGGRWIEPQAYLVLLERIVALELNNGQYASALRNFEHLRAIGGKGEMFERLVGVVERVKENVVGDRFLAVPATVTAARQCEFCEADWQHTLLRRQFEFNEIDGQLGKMEIRCDYQRVVDEAREGVSWTLPESWGSCNVIVFGEADTTFTLLEHPTSS